MQVYLVVVRGQDLEIPLPPEVPTESPIHYYVELPEKTAYVWATLVRPVAMSHQNRRFHLKT